MADDDTTTMERESGTSSMKCPNCGKKLNEVTEADGGTSYETCTSCFGTTKQAEKAAADDVKQAKEVARERGTDTAPEE